jgi:hypothetical protein
MVQRLVSVLLILSFMASVSHDVIPHHHPHLEVFVASTSPSHQHPEKQSHHQTDQSNKEHKNSYPFHQHETLTDDLYCLRFSPIRITENDLHSPEFCCTLQAATIIAPGVTDHMRRTLKCPRDKISSFKHGSVGLRAPPVIV